MQRTILHIDMNSYFASVEQQANPFLRGKAVGVCAYLSENGCVLASSTEAKQHGVRTGMRMRDARSLWPSTVFLQNDPPKYRSTTERIFNILAEYTDQIEPYSIDEAFLDLTGHVPSLAEGSRIGYEINRRIKQEVGEWLRSSVGIAETRFLAKLASDTGPKDAVTILPIGALSHYLARLDLEDIWGIAGALRRRFETLAIRTPLDLKQADPHRILLSLGKQGYYLWAAVNGYEMHQATLQQESPKSIGHSYCLAKKTKEPHALARILMKLSEKTGRRLRAAGFDARNISIGLGCEDGSHCSRQHHLPLPLFDSFQIFKESWALLEADLLPARVRMLAVSVSSFTPPSYQYPLPLRREDREQGIQPRSARRSLARALDAVNDKWGEYTVMRGAMFGTDQNAPDRIGYRKTLKAPEVSKTLTSLQTE